MRNTGTLFPACKAMYELLSKRSFSTVEKMSEVSGYSISHTQNILLKLEQSGCVEMVRRERDGRLRRLWKVTGVRPVMPAVVYPPRNAPRLSTAQRSQNAIKAINKHKSPVINAKELASINSIWGTK